LSGSKEKAGDSKTSGRDPRNHPIKLANFFPRHVPRILFHFFFFASLLQFVRLTKGDKEHAIYKHETDSGIDRRDVQRPAIGDIPQEVTRTEREDRFPQIVRSWRG
jgi:hypothetical protein